MRLTVAWTCLFVFILLTMVWYRLDYTIPRSQIYSFWFDSSDVVTGIVGLGCDISEILNNYVIIIT